MCWNKDSILEFLKKNPYFDDFVKGNVWCLCYSLKDVKFVVASEEVGIEYYFRSPYDSSIDYSPAYTFFDASKPILSNIEENQRTERLMDSPANK